MRSIQRNIEILHFGLLNVQTTPGKKTIQNIYLCIVYNVWMYAIHFKWVGEIVGTFYANKFFNQKNIR